MRRLITFALLFVVLAALWSGGWFALAAWAEGRVSTVLAEIAARGIEVDCQGRDMVGFPFAMRVACGATAVSAPRSGSEAQLDGLTGGASVFAPMTAEIALASPARVESPLFTAPASFAWEETEIDVGMGLNGPKSVSFEAANLLADLPIAGMADARFAAATADGTLSPTGDGGTDASLAFTGLTLSANGATLPSIAGSASAELTVPPRALLSGRAGLQAPLSARAVRVTLTSGGARLDADGDLSVDAEGVLDGTMTLRVAGAEALPAFIAALPPAMRQLGNAMVGGMLAFGQATEVNGQAASQLVVEIERGRARVGPVDFRVPRIPL